MKCGLRAFAGLQFRVRACGFAGSSLGSKPSLPVMDRRRPSVLMKMAIEGSEVEVLEDLLETGSLFWLDAVMAELHEFNTPSEERREKSRALRERLSRQDAIN